MRAPLMYLAASAALLAGCTDFATPAELTKPTILAVIAEPPLVAPGASTTLSVVLAGPDGPIAADDAAVTWTLSEAVRGVPPFGMIEPGDDGTAVFRAPDPLPELPEGVPPLTALAVTVETDDASIEALKAIAVLDMPSSNPTIAAIEVDGAVAGEGMTLARGATVELAIDADREPTEDGGYAWYSTVGGIEQYQSNPTELVVSDEAGDGWLFAVLRDGLGGVAVRGVQLTVE